MANDPIATKPLNNPFNNAYSDEDLARWSGYEGGSTVRVMNDIRADAGYKTWVEFGADDKTATETKAEQEELSASNLGLHGAGGVLHIAAEGFVEGSLAGAGLVTTGVIIELFATGKEIIAGDEISSAAERDTMHAAMLANLDVPKGYKEEKMRKIMSKYTDGWQSGAQKIAEQARLNPADRRKMALVQIHADQGANAARRMLDANMSREKFLEQNPSIAKRYLTDPAFHHGFDSMEWAKKAGPNEYKAAVDDLEARDARYAAAHVSVRL
jgi:hypothetical protein